jgi:hypothetical protein
VASAWWQEGMTATESLSTTSRLQAIIGVLGLELRKAWLRTPRLHCAASAANLAGWLDVC